MTTGSAEGSPDGKDEGNIPVLVRLPKSHVDRFKDLQPWHGTISNFMQQALAEFLKLSEGQKTPSDLTSEAVSNVVRRSY